MINDNNHKGDLSGKLLRMGFRLLRHAVRLKYPLQMTLGRFIGRRMMQLDSEQTRIAAINIDTCFPMLSPQQNRELLREHFENVGMGIMEMAISWWMPDDAFKQLIQVKGLGNLQNALSRGKGVIFASAQFTSSEILIRCLGRLLPLTEICLPHHNHHLELLLREQHARLVTHYCLHEDVRLISESLKQNHAVLFNHDLSPSHKQMTFANFFSIPAATNTAVSRFARMTRATVLPVSILRRENNEGYFLVIESPLPDFPGEDIDTDAQRLNLVVERWIERNPAQYGWNYPRFRQRPAGEPQFY